MRPLLKDAHRHPSATASLLIVFMEMIQTHEATRSSSGDFTCLGDLKIIRAEQGRIGRFRERGRRTEPEVDEEDSQNRGDEFGYFPTVFYCADRWTYIICHRPITWAKPDTTILAQGPRIHLNYSTVT